jgi:hypothetical protein
VNWLGISIDVWGVLAVAAAVLIVSRIVRRLRGGRRPDTTITFGRVEREPLLDDAPSIEPRDDQQWDDARSVVPELVDVLTVMQANLDGLDGIDHRSLAQEGEAVPRSMRQLATQTFGRIRHLDTATVQFLPDDLSHGWHSLLRLLEEFRQFGPGSSDPWPDAVLDRNRRDVIRYLDITHEALIDFARSANVAEYFEPPDLRRSDLEAWEPS